MHPGSRARSRTEWGPHCQGATWRTKSEYILKCWPQEPLLLHPTFSLPGNRELQEQSTRQKPSPHNVFLILTKKQNFTIWSPPLHASQNPIPPSSTRHYQSSNTTGLGVGPGAQTQPPQLKQPSLPSSPDLISLLESLHQWERDLGEGLQGSLGACSWEGSTQMADPTQL